MKKVKLLFSFFVCLTLVPQLSLASGSGNAQIAQIMNIATAGAAGAFSAANFSICSPTNPMPCVLGIMGALQALQSLMGAANSGQTGSDLVNGDFGSFKFDPTENGFCFDPSQGCKQTDLDKQLSDFNEPFKTGEGFDDALAKLRAEATQSIKDAEKKGFKIDTKNGTITGPNGKITTFAAASAKIPKNFGAEAQKKFAGVVEQIKDRDKKRGIASNGGAGGGGIAYQDEYSGGGSDKNYGKKKPKKSRASLLASLTDKGAKKGGIGVAGDDIFGMVNRRYLTKTKSAEFLKK